MPERILVAVPDLLLQSRITAAACALEFEVAIGDSDATALAALDPAPSLVVVDLQAAGINAGALIAAAKAAGAAVLAFGRHTEPLALRAARAAGADRAVARSELVEQLPELLTQYGAAKPR
jgi:DNA-binding NarL/FixJ family response regulator